MALGAHIVSFISVHHGCVFAVVFKKMGAHAIVPVVVCVFAVAGAWALWRSACSGRKEKERHRSSHDGFISYSNPNNNHDHNKVKYETKKDAELEVARMQRLGLSDSDRLNVYYNRELQGFFVGRSKFD